MGFSWEDLQNVINPPLGDNSADTFTDAGADADQERNIDQSDDSDNESKSTHHRIYTNSSSNYNNSYSTSSRNSSSSSSSSSSSNCDSLHARFKLDCHWWSWSILCPSQLGTSLVILFFYTIKSFIQIYTTTY